MLHVTYIKFITPYICTCNIETYRGAPGHLICVFEVGGGVVLI